LIQILCVNVLLPVGPVLCGRTAARVNRCGASPAAQRRHQRTADKAFRRQKKRNRRMRRFTGR
jgi:hypothetical protein